MATVEEFVQKLKGLNAPLTNNFLFGVVTSVDPIKVKVEGYPELNKNQIILGELVREQKIKVPNKEKPKHKHKIKTLTTSTGGQDSHTHTIQGFETEEALEEITLREGLKKGDKVFIIQSNDKQLFYIMERILKDDTTS